MCSGFWGKGFKVKVDQDKSSLYLKIASRLVLTNSWPQEAREMILGLGCHVGTWAAQDPPSTALGAAFPTLQPCWKAGKLAMFSREVISLDIYVQSTDFNVQFSSVAQLCPTLCDPMNRSTLGLPVYHQHPEFTQSHVHRVSDAIQPSHPLSSPSPPAPNLSQHQSLFQWVNSSHEVAKVLEFQL